MKDRRSARMASTSICADSGVRMAIALALYVNFIPVRANGETLHPNAPIALLPPVISACVSSPFGPRILANRPLAGTFHSGIDLPAPVGSPVVAVAPGHLIRVQRRGVGGLEILIQHEGFIGVYSHLGLIAPMVAEGKRAIYGGEKIGSVGRSGLTYGPHLYFGVIIQGHAVDPAPLLKVDPCSMVYSTSRDSRLRSSRFYATH